MKIDRQLFINRLEMVAPALGSQSSSIDSQCFKIFDGSIQASNGVILMETGFPPTMNVDLRCSVPGEPLLSLLKSLKSDEIEIKKSKDGKHLIVTTNKLEGKFLTTDQEKMAKVSASKDSCKKIYESSNGVSELVCGLIKCKDNVSKNENDGPMRGVRIDGDVVISTNRFRIFKYLVPNTNIQCTVPIEFINVIGTAQNAVSDMLYMDCTSLIAIIGDDTFLTTKPITGAFPQLDQYFPDEKSDNAKTISFTNEVHDVLSRHASLIKNLDQADRESTITICGNECTIVTKHAAVGELTEVISLESPVDDQIQFLINPLMLKDIVSGCKSFTFYTDSRLVLFESNNTKHLVQTRE